MKIALIDTGIENSFKRYVSEFYYIENQEICEGNRKTQNNHGGICAAVIKKYFAESEIISIQMLDRNGEADIESLVYSLKWCLKHDVKIISLSLGSVAIEDKEKLVNTIQALLKQNVVLVAAANNTNTVTYPASLEGVIGVKCDLSGVLDSEEIFVDKNDIRNIEVTVGTLKDCDGLKQYNLGYHNSFVVPYVTAKIAQSIKEKRESLVACITNTQSVPKEFYVNSFPFLYKADSIIAQLSGKDFEEEQLSKMVKMFRKKGYVAIGISEHPSNTEYCYNCVEKNGLTRKENYEFIIKAMNPDIVFVSSLTFEIPKDIEIAIDNSKEFDTGKQRGCDFVKEDEYEHEETSYLGTIGNYGITMTGDVKELTEENVFFDDEISEEERKLIISKVQDQIGVCVEDEKSLEKIFIKSEDVYTEKIIEILEEIFS